MRRKQLIEYVALTEGVINSIVPCGFGRARMTIVYKINNLFYCITEIVHLQNDSNASDAMEIAGVNSKIILRYIPGTPSMAYSPTLFSKNNKIFIKK